MLEHFPVAAQAALARGCHDWLKPGGVLIITVPSPQVDAVLAVLTRLRLVQGMSLEQHYGFKPSTTRAIFEPAGFDLMRQKRFQLGLNNLFVFERK